MNWWVIDDFTYNITYKDGSISDETIIYEKAIEGIKNGTPIMLHYYDTKQYSSDKSKTHWVIIVGYDENSTSIDDLIVCDPSTRDDTCVNALWTLRESKTWNMPDVSQYYYGYVTTSK